MDQEFIESINRMASTEQRIKDVMVLVLIGFSQPLA